MSGDARAVEVSRECWALVETGQGRTVGYVRPCEWQGRPCLEVEPVPYNMTTGERDATSIVPVSTILRLTPLEHEQALRIAATTNARPPRGAR